MALPPNWIAMVATCRPEHVGKLSETREVIALVEILGEIFPSEFARIRDTRFAIDPESGLPTGVRRLLELVTKRLFPLWDGCEVGEYDLGSIPFVPFFDFAGFEEEPGAYGSGLALAYGLMGYESYGDDSYGYGAVDCPLVDQVRELAPVAANTVSFERLVERAARLRTPLRHLPLAIEIADRASGNPFLHGGCECGSCGRIAWSTENVRALVIDHREARAGLRKLDRLTAWLDVDPGKHVAEAVRFWNACVDPKKATVKRTSEGGMDVAAA